VNLTIKQLKIEEQ